MNSSSLLSPGAGLSRATVLLLLGAFSEGQNFNQLTTLCRGLSDTSLGPLVKEQGRILATT
jgi:hypothetical protein